MRTTHGWIAGLAIAFGCALGCELVTGLTGDATLGNPNGTGGASSSASSGSTSASSGSSSTSSGSNSTSSGSSSTSSGSGGGTGGSPGCQGNACVLWATQPTSSSEELAVTSDTAGGAIFVGDTSTNGTIDSLTPDGTAQMGFFASFAGVSYTAITFESSGFAIVGGYTPSVIPGSNGNTIPPGLFILQVPSSGHASAMGLLGAASGSAVNDVTILPNGNDVACGEFLGTISYGTTSVPANSGTNGMGTNAWLVKPDGTLLTWGGPMSARCTGARVDASSNVFVTGTFQQQITIATGAQTLSAVGSTNVFLARIGATSGTVDWQYRFGDTNTQATGLALDGSGNVVVVGQFSGTIAFNGTPYTAPTGGTSLFAAAYSNDGTTVLWSYALGGGSGEIHVSVDTNGNTLLAGGYHGTITLDGQSATATGSDEDVFAAKLDKTGKIVWLRTYGGPGDQTVHGVAATPSGDALIAGYNSGTLDIGAMPLVSTGMSAFVAELAP